MNPQIDLLTRRRTIKTAFELCASASFFCTFPALTQINFNLEEETRISRSAKYRMVFASPYSNDEWKVTPHMHAELKKNVQEMSQGQIFVDIRDDGEEGVGPVLMEKVSRGILSAALVSASNLSPVAPELDILNIPFWSASNQKYINLVTSSSWKKLIIDKINSQRKIHILFHYVPGSRTATSTKIYGKTIRTPSDTKGVRFRIPSSNVLKVFYGLTGALPQKVAWGKVAEYSKNNLIDAMDPSIIGLFSGPGRLRNHIGVISEIDSVHDGWVAVISQRWFQSLPPKLRIVLHEAAEKTFIEHLTKVAQVTEYCKQGFETLGTKIHTPSDDEKAIWLEFCGHNHPAWAPVKRRIIGSQKRFNELLEAANVNNGYIYS